MSHSLTPYARHTPAAMLKHAARAARAVSASEWELGAWLLAIDRTRAYQSSGFRSTVTFCIVRLGLEPQKVSNLLRIMAALEGLPLLSAAYQAGELGYGKVREITRVATTETEGAWLEFARGHTTEQVRQRVVCSPAAFEKRVRSVRNEADSLFARHRGEPRGTSLAEGSGVACCSGLKLTMPADQGPVCVQEVEVQSDSPALQGSSCSRAPGHRANTSDDRSERPVSDDRSERPVSDDRSERPVSDDRSERPVSDDRSERPVSDDRSERPVSDDRSERPVSDDRSERPVSDDRSERPLSDDQNKQPISDDRSERPVSDEREGRRISTIGALGESQRQERSVSLNERVSAGPEDQASPSLFPEVLEDGLPAPQRVRVMLELSAEEYAEWAAAVERISRQLGRRASSREVMLELIRRHLASATCGSLQRSPVVVRLDPTGAGSVETDRGPLPVSSASSREYLSRADALVVPSGSRDETSVVLLRQRRRKKLPHLVVQTVVARAGGCCECCGQRGVLQIHHIRALSRGGSNAPENLRLLCSACHAREHAGDFQAGSPWERARARRQSQSSMSPRTPTRGDPSVG